MTQIIRHAILRNWRREGQRLHGQIYGDNRFEDGDFVYTTQIMIFDHKNLTAVTKNGTEYTLQAPVLAGDINLE